MKEIEVYNAFKERNETVLVDDNMYHWLRRNKKEIHFNNRGYPMIEAFEKMRPLHCVVYYLNKKEWSVQWQTGLHHRNENKLDARISNLEMRDWDSHGLEHSLKKGYYATPRPDKLRIA